MNVRTLGVLTVAALLAPAIVFSQSAPPRDKPSTETPTGTARLRGRVVGADTGTPLRRAQVRAVASAIRTTRLTSTDAEGRYEFANLPGGRYTITVNKAGYVGLEFGQHRPFEGGRPLEIADGQTAEAIDFALPRGSVIAGRITDEAGDPIIGASVYAMRYRYTVGGRRRLVPIDSASWLSNTTNDLGEYRLFGLMPGTYLVAAQFRNTGVVSLTPTPSQTGGISSVDIRDGFLQTYFPGSANVAEARPVIVDLSDEANASFSLAAGRMSKISGIVRRSDGGVATGSTIELRPSDLSGATMGGWGNSSVAADGSFSFANVPPGQYVLQMQPRRQAIDVNTGAVIRQGSEEIQTPEFAQTRITVGGADLAGLAITSRPGITVSGHVAVQGGPNARTSKGLRIEAASADTSDDGGFELPSTFGVGDENGRFQIRNVTGLVLFRPFLLTNDLVLKSVSLKGVDITDRPYDSNNVDISGLEIVIVDQALVRGGATNVRGEPVRDFRVALFPTGAKPSAQTTRFMHTSRADTNGRFQIGRLPAGEYLGVAVESFEQGQEWDPAFQQRVLPAAKRFAVKEGQTLTIDLPFVE